MKGRTFDIELKAPYNLNRGKRDFLQREKAPEAIRQ